jgi:hypothetical protein
MPDDGCVDRAIVLSVLRASGVSVSKCSSDPTGEMVTLAKGDRIEDQKLPDPVGRHMLHYLDYHFGVPIHHFYHPDMMSNQSAEPPSNHPVQ